MATIFFTLGSGLLIPAIIIGLIFTIGAVSVFIRFQQINASQKKANFVEAARTGNLKIIRGLLNKAGLSAAHKMALLNYKDNTKNTALMWAAAWGHAEIVREILNTAGLSLTDKMTLLNDTQEYGKTALLKAADNGCTEVVREILNTAGLSLEHKIALLNYKSADGDTALKTAVDGDAAEVVREILNTTGLSFADKMTLFTHKNNQGVTVLMAAASYGHVGIVREIFNTNGLSLEYKMILLNPLTYPDVSHMLAPTPQVIHEILNINGLSLEYKMAMLNHKDYNGATTFIYAALHGCTDIVHEILTMTGLSLAHKMTLVNHKNNLGCTALMYAAIHGHTEVVREILNSVPPDQRPLLLTYQNPIDNQTMNAIVFAFENGHHDLVTLLQQYGAVLPVHLLRAGGINDRQSTHTATVHDSLARSAMACVARLENIPQREKGILTKWAKGKTGEADDVANQHAALQIMGQENIQNSLNSLVSMHYKDIIAWANGLDNNNPKKAIIIRALDRIATFTTHRESRTYLTLTQTLVLTWIGIKTNYKDKTKPFSESELTDRLNRFAQYLWEIQRQYNLNDNGKDRNPNAADHPACPGGTFNNLVMPLTGGADPDVNFIFVNEASVKSKAMAVLSQLFIPTEPEYTPEIIQEMNKAFLEDLTYKISPAVQSILRAKLLEKLHKEFDEYVASKMLRADSIGIAAEVALAKPNSDLATAIENKLTALKESKAKSPESQTESITITKATRP